MKIVFAMTHTFRPDDGGAAFSMYNLIRELSKKHRCRSFANAQAIKMYGILPNNKQRARINAKHGERSLRKLIETDEPDIIHTSGFGSCLLGLMVKKTYGIPWVHHCRSPSDTEYFASTLSQADHIILIGNYMNRFGLPNAPKTVIYNPLSFPVEPLFSPDDKNGMMMVSGGDHRKGTHIGIKAWSMLADRPRLAIYGRIYRKAMRSMKDLPRLKYHGFVPNREIHEALKEATLAMFPITVQGFGVNRVMLESQSVGTLTLTSAGFDKYDDPPIRNSMCFSPKVHEIKRAIERVLSMDPSEYEARSRKAYEWVRENCTAKNCAKKIEKVYGSLT